MKGVPFVTNFIVHDVVLYFFILCEYSLIYNNVTTESYYLRLDWTIVIKSTFELQLVALDILQQRALIEIGKTRYNCVGI